MVLTRLQEIYEAVIAHEATPIAPSRKNARIRRGGIFVHRNAAGCRMQAIGPGSMARSFESQVNKLYITGSHTDRLTELGRPQTAAVA